jgi:hypothetical protein
MLVRHRSRSTRSYEVLLLSFEVNPDRSQFSEAPASIAS